MENLQYAKYLNMYLKKIGLTLNLVELGKPILDLDTKGNPLFIVEASSFQLAYSKYIKPKSAVILNVIKDHLDWHGSLKIIYTQI